MPLFAANPLTPMQGLAGKPRSSKGPSISLTHSWQVDGPLWGAPKTPLELALEGLAELLTAAVAGSTPATPTGPSVGGNPGVEGQGVSVGEDCNMEDDEKEFIQSLGIGTSEGTALLGAFKRLGVDHAERLFKKLRVPQDGDGGGAGSSP